MAVMARPPTTIKSHEWYTAKPKAVLKGDG